MVPVLHSPSLHTLQECFAELKFGRTVEDQQFLNGCISRLDDDESTARPNDVAEQTSTNKQMDAITFGCKGCSFENYVSGVCPECIRNGDKRSDYYRTK